MRLPDRQPRGILFPLALPASLLVALALPGAVLAGHSTNGAGVEETMLLETGAGMGRASIDETRPTSEGSGTGASAPRTLRRGEGLAFRLEGGWASWRLDEERLAAQVGSHDHVRAMLLDSVTDAPAVALQIGYTVLGHAGLALDLAATGWSLSNRNRGGGGLVSLLFLWHPVELLSHFQPDLPIGHDRFWDVSLFGGLGWSAVGQDRALRGLPSSIGHLAMGLRADLYVAPWATLGASLRYYALRFDEYVIHWDEDQFVELPDRSGGSLLLPMLNVTLRAPTGG